MATVSKFNDSETKRAQVCVRVTKDMRSFLEEQAKMDGPGISAVIYRLIRKAMVQHAQALRSQQGHSIPGNSA